MMYSGNYINKKHVTFGLKKYEDINDVHKMVEYILMHDKHAYHMLGDLFPKSELVSGNMLKTIIKIKGRTKNNHQFFKNI